MIVEGENRSIVDIFADGGEALFRKIESQTLATAIAKPTSILSLGGGTIIRQTNRDLIRENGCCVWLTASAPTIAARIAGDAASAANRPALTDQPAIVEIQSLLQKRHQWYDQVADRAIDTEQTSSEQIASQIASEFGDRIHRWIGH